MGLIGNTKEDKPFIVYARFHYVTICFAVVCTEVFAVSIKIYER